MIRIIAGKYKNMAIPTAKNASYRPSTGKFREAIFSILTSGKIIDRDYLENSAVLDMFAGTGSLGFEALSRGAKSVSFIDKNRTHLQVAEQFALKIGRAEDVTFLYMDVLRLAYSTYKYDLIFIDPPYHNDLISKSLSALLSKNWCNDNALVVIESAKTEDFVVLDTNQLELVMERVYGNSKLTILRYSQTS